MGVSGVRIRRSMDGINVYWSSLLSFRGYRGRWTGFASLLFIRLVVLGELLFLVVLRLFLGKDGKVRCCFLKTYFVVRVLFMIFWLFFEGDISRGKGVIFYVVFFS